MRSQVSGQILTCERFPGMTEPAPSKNSQQTMTLVAMGVVAAGSCLPWASVLGFNVSGLEGDGVLTLFGAAVGLLLFALSRPRQSKKPKVGQKANHITGIVISALSLLIALNAHSSFAAIGLYLTIAGSGVWLYAAIKALRSLPAAASTAPPLEGR